MELEKLLRKQPNYMLPEGYTVQKETVQISNFSIPKSFQISESQKISLEIID